MSTRADSAVAGPGPSTSSRRSMSSSHGPTGAVAGLMLDLTTFGTKLHDTSIDVKVKCGMLADLRDLLEFRTRETDLARNFEFLVPAVLKALETTQPVFSATGFDYKYRHSLVDTLQRLPMHEIMRPFAVSVAQTCLAVVRSDNEENTAVCLKIVLDYHRNFKTLLDPILQAWIDVLVEMFVNFPITMEETFGEAAIPAAADPLAEVVEPSPTTARTRPSGSAGAGGMGQEPVELPKGMKSFKVLHEVPVAVVQILQMHREESDQTLKRFESVVAAALRAQPAPQTRCHAAAANQGKWPFLGVAPAITAANKRQQFGDCLILQVKIVNFLAYVLRSKPVNAVTVRDIPPAILRLLKSMPTELSASRKELIMAIRHVQNSESRPKFIEHLDEFLDPRIWLGPGICSESTRHGCYNNIADLAHACHRDLTISQIKTIVFHFTSAFHDPTLTIGQYVVICKLFSTITDVLPFKVDPEAQQLWHWVVEAFVDKLEAIAALRDHWPGSQGRNEEEMANETADQSKDSPKEKSNVDLQEEDQDTVMEDPIPKPAIDLKAEEAMIEKAKVVGSVPLLVGNAPECVSAELRFLIRNILSTLASMATVKSLSMPTDPRMYGRLWAAGLRCITIYEARREHRELREVLDSFSHVFLSLDLLVLVEAVEPNIDVLFEETAMNLELVTLAQQFLSNSMTSRTFLGILMRALIARIPTLSADKHIHVVFKLFKMCFMAVTIFPDNESVLQPYVGNLVIDSLNLATQVTDSSGYYVLLRSLFRSVGGGRFEALYKEVLPLLQTILEELNRLLSAATEPREKDMFAELSLTVPVRLSALLPYLSFLMRPLVAALHGGADLIGQALRTLELCIDNLTAEFLKPLMAPVIYDVMEGLWQVLKPLPYSHQLAHSTVRILGKLGGRNRKWIGLSKLNWKVATEECVMAIWMNGEERNLRLSPAVELACSIMRRADQHYRTNSFEVLKHAAPLLLQNEVLVGEKLETFGTLVKGLFTASRSSDYGTEATKLILDMADYIFTSELWCDPKASDRPRSGSTISLALLEALLDNVANADTDGMVGALKTSESVLKRLLTRAKTEPPPNVDIITSAMRIFTSKVCSACYDHSLPRKISGCALLGLLVSDLDMGVPWLRERELEIVRALLFAHKDSPGLPASKLRDPKETLLSILRTCNTLGDDTKLSDSAENKLNYLIGLLVMELQSQTAIIRSLARECLSTLSECTKRPLGVLVNGHKDRFNGIFSKPLRALAFPLQIGHLDALTYSMNLQPPLYDWGESMMRILGEALGIADADDAALLGRAHAGKTATPLVQLRVVCVRFLATALASAEFKNGQIRGRILAAYFKLLYARAPEVVDAAHQSLKELLSTQDGRLPKDLLQSGLRPVLMNLSDHKKLTVASLQGLARLLEILTNYFKVEIGSKLLDHFRSLSDPNTLRAAAIGPETENGELKVMSAIVNVFHLLPQPQAQTFLRDLVEGVAKVEAILCKVTASPFTKPLGQYLDQYQAAAADYFLHRIAEPLYSNTLLTVLASEYAPSFRSYLCEKAADWLQDSYSKDLPTALNASKLLRQLAEVDPQWISQAATVVDFMRQRWVSGDRKSRLSSSSDEHVAQTLEDRVVLDIMMICIQQAPLTHVDLLFHIADVFTHTSPADYSRVARFLVKEIVCTTDLDLKRRVLARFMVVMGNAAVPSVQKMAVLRHIINPLLLVAFRRGAAEANIVDSDCIIKIQEVIWTPYSTQASRRPGGEALELELLQMTRLVVENRHQPLVEIRKDVIKFGWMYANTKYPDWVVKHAAHLLLARFLDGFETPTKIVTTFMSSLLKFQVTEARDLATEALDTLIGACPKRFKHAEWVGILRAKLVDDASNLASLHNLYGAIVRKQDVVFPYRDQLVPALLSGMPRLALLNTNNSDYRTLTIDMAEMMVDWDQRRSRSVGVESTPVEAGRHTGPDDKPSPKRPRYERSGSAVPSVAESDKGNTYAMPFPYRDQVVTVLVRILTATADVNDKTPLMARTLRLLKKIMLEVWPETEIKLAYFERMVMAMDETRLVNLRHTYDVMGMWLVNKPDNWILENIATFRSVIERGLSFESTTLHRAQEPMISRVMSAVVNITDQSSKSQFVQEFEQWVPTSIAQGLEQTSSPRRSLSATLILLETWSKDQHSRIADFIPGVTQLFQKAVREHLTACAPERNDGAVIDQTRKILERLCTILKPHVATMGEQRRWLLQGLVQLVEKSTSTELCRFILEFQRRWVTEKESMPTIKEKASMLIKMMSFDSRGEELYRDYLLLILEIYTDPSYARSELTVRLEQAFLLGCRSSNPTVRTRFMEVFDASISRVPFSRLHYIVGVQNWEFIANTQWIHQALDLLVGAISSDEPLVLSAMLPLPVGSSSSFLEWAQGLKAEGFLKPARRLLYADSPLAAQVWTSLFAAVWSTFTKREQSDMTRYLVGLLTKDYLLKNAERRFTSVSIILEGLRLASPLPILPPHLLRYIGKTYNSWHIALELLQDMFEDPREDETVRETIGDALAQMYAELGEDDHFYGLWRRRTISAETNAAMSYEQVGEWDAAERAYETAQSKGRANVLNFGRGEYHIWEDHWVLCAEKMQQWDLLMDLARAEGNSELLLEASWRQQDWVNDRDAVQQAVDSLPATPTPRRSGFDAYLALLRGANAPKFEDRRAEFTKICDEGIQLTLRRWHQLPKIVGGAHVPLLQAFQQFVELQEASQIFASLQGTNQQNLDTKSAELKHVLQTWRERLPNPWDDINIWSDLVAWRQHVFTSINKAYLPLIPATHAGQSANANSYAYRGYHETAWIINRFAHVARKHRLNEVCSSALTKIYTLPNIEIQEAFLKLREQAKCHFQNPAELGQGLDVINNTNLMYFGLPQKAEFFTLKGMFLARLGLHEEAAQVFSQAVGMDMQFPKGWAEWGAYQDRLFEKSPANLNLAANAVNSYLQAASLYRTGKIRKLLVRILWLLALDDSQGTIHKALESFKGDLPTWHWTYFIPQLLACLGNTREAGFAKIILLKIAKTFPQALFYAARTSRDEIMMMKKVLDRQVAAAQAAAANGGNANGDGTNQGSHPTPAPRFRALEVLNEIASHAKTQFPLLTLSMEMLVDQLFQRFKPTSEEDVYRLIQALLTDALQQYVLRAADPDDTLELNEVTKANVARMSDNLSRMPLQPTFYADFVEKNPTLPLYIQRLQHWRKDYEKRLDRRTGKFSLENNSHYLIEFQYQKFDEIEVPGQYMKRHNEDNNSHFVKIVRFVSNFEVVRARDHCNRRITMIGHDGTSHSFLIQTPPPRPSRREEKIMQLFRMLDCPLSRKKETRQREASFNIPVAVPLAANIRLMETEASYCSLQDVWDKHCVEQGIGKDDPVITYAERMRSFGMAGTDNTDLVATKLEIAEEIMTKFVPEDVLKRFMQRTLASAGDLWFFRKRMSVQMASFIFLTNVMSINSRCLHRIHIDRGSGNMFTSDLLPALHPSKPEHHNSEPVPFRLTPNIQHFLLRQNIDGIMTATILAIGHALTEHDHDLEHRLSIFIRDEVFNWYLSHSVKPPGNEEQTVPALVHSITNSIVKRAKILACEMERANINQTPATPVCQAVTELINQATNITRLYQSDPIWMPAF